MFGPRLWAMVVAALVVPPQAQTSPGDIIRTEGETAGGSHWLAEKPMPWNGTVLLWSHGYAPTARPPEDGPPAIRAALLAKGYALLGSTYATTGWALREAVPDQIAALDAFAQADGAPKRVIAWGQSMGGLVTAALAERHPDRLGGALPICASSGGAVGMMNMALDGAFAFVTLAAPDAGIRLVRTGDDIANGKRAQVAVAAARQTAEGRARLLLAGVLAGLPDWTNGPRPPAPGDADAIAAQMAQAFVMGVFLPRADQEARAGGVFSWNTGVDYGAQLDRSARRALVERAYRAAGLDLAADLDRLKAGPRIAADPGAVRYMIDNFTPSGRIGVPVLVMHTIGDGATSPALAGAFRETIRAAGQGDRAAFVWNARAGHCTSTGAELLAALAALEARIATGRWDTTHATLTALAGREAPGDSAFVDYTPPPMLRPCRASAGRCAR